MNASRSSRSALGLAFFLPFALYLRWPSYQWNVDGVACAAALELGNPVYLFHADHLLYGALGYGTWKGLLAPLGILRALPALQLMTGFLTAVGLVGLCQLLAHLLDGDRWKALAITLAIALSAVVWVWSVEAQVYSLGFAGLAWSTYLLVATKSPAGSRWTGILYGVGVLGHLMHLLWILPAAFWVFRSSEDPASDKWRRLATIALYSMTTVMLAYFLVFQIVLQPAHLSHAALMNWIKGSAGLTTDRRWGWHTQGLTAPWQWARASLSFFWGSFWPYANTLVSRGVWLLTIVSMASVSVVLFGGLRPRPSVEARFALLWVAVYALLLWTWEPSTLCYRMSEGIPLAVLLGLGLRRFAARTQWLLLGSIVVSLFLVTWSTRIRAMNRPDSNTLFVNTQALANATPPQSLYLTTGGVTWIYLLYFTGRKAWNVDHLLPLQIEAALAASVGRTPVLLDVDIYTRPDPPAWIASRHWTHLDPLPWMELQ